MKRFFMILSVLLVFATQTFADVNAGQGDVRTIQDTRPIIWPWSLASEFPWDEINGTWKVEEGDIISYFSFRVVPGVTPDKNQLLVRQIDGYLCQGIAWGKGTLGLHVVTAQMMDLTGLEFEVTFTSFLAKDVAQIQQSRRSEKSVLLASIVLHEAQDRVIHRKMTRISKTTSLKRCHEALKR